MPKDKMIYSDILCHYGNCEACGNKTLRIAHFNYSKQGKNPRIDYCLCTRCLAKGICLFSYELGKNPNELIK